MRGVHRSETEDATAPPARLDGVHEDERDTEADGEADGHRDELERGLEAGHVGRGHARRLLRREREQAAVPEAGRQLEEDAGDLQGKTSLLSVDRAHHGEDQRENGAP